MGLLGRLAAAVIAKERAVIIHKGDTVPIGKKVVKIGRRARPAEKRGHDLFLDKLGDLGIVNSPIYTMTVSVGHAQLTWDAEVRKYIFQDVGSTKGSEINGTKVERGEKALLRNEDKITLGGTFEMQILYS
tara:strand:- start:398 stop:790 length:393 start_codon:yes stop_codon:yes gene_type:complete